MKTVKAPTSVIDVERACARAESEYRKAAADLTETLKGSNVEAARAALRAHVGPVKLVPQNGQLYAEGSIRIGSGGRI